MSQEQESLRAPAHLRTLNSPLLLIVLFPLVCWLSMGWYHANAALRAPILPGYDWAKHSDALLISYPPNDCGCAPIADLVSLGLHHGLDVVAVADAPSSMMDALKKDKLPANRLSVITNVPSDIIKSLGVHDKPIAWRIHNGRVVGRSLGGIPSDAFFEAKEVTQ